MTAPIDGSPQRYEFADLALDVGQRRVWRGSREIPLTKLTFDVLHALVEAAPNLVTHDELAAQVWGPRRIVTHENLTQRLLMLRQSLGDEAANPSYIESMRGQGYRLIPPVVRRCSTDESGAAPARAAAHRKTGYPGQMFSVGVIAALVLASVLSWNRTPERIDELLVPAPQSARLPSSIAVLPFEILGPEPDNAFFAAAMHAELLNELGKNAALNVIARASVRHYADNALPVRRIADELRVGAVMRGTVRYSAERIHVIAELVDVDTSLQLWSEAYDGSFDDLFAIQLDMTRNIALALGAGFSPEADARIEALPTTSPEAYAFFMRAMDVFNEQAIGSRSNAQIFLDQAIALDPDFALAYAGKALVHVYSLTAAGDVLGNLPRSEAVPLIHELISTALALDPSTDLAHYALGMLELFTRRWDAAHEAIQRAVELTPQHAVFRSQLGWLEVCVLEQPSGLGHNQRGVALDPQNPYVHQLFTNVLECLGDDAAALAAAERALQMDPTAFPNLMRHAFAVGRFRGPEAGLRELATLEPLLTENRVLSIPPVAVAYRSFGRPDEGRRLFERFVELAPQRQTGPANWYLAYAAIEDYESAYLAIRRAVDDPGPGPGFYTLISFMRNNGDVPVLQEPRFQELRDRLRAGQ